MPSSGCRNPKSDLMHFIILDLEATCWQGNAMDRNQEIIELGAYRVNGYGEWIDHFQTFVRPVMHPRLSTYCMDLTGISQEQVSKSKPFDQAFLRFEEWLHDIDGTSVLCTWGARDMEIIREECERHDQDASALPMAINLKAQYARIHNLPREVGLMKALEFIEMEFEGSHHRAIDDAFNTTKLFLHYLDRWQY